MGQTIIVSNRLPVNIKKINGKLDFSISTGGLATGVAGFASKQKDIVWIGWPGMPSEDLTATEKREIERELVKQNCRPVFLTKAQIEGFYNNFSNSILWQVLHHLPREQNPPASWWKTYREVNDVFAAAVKRYQKADSTIWIHDYHLLLLPLILRRQSPLASIGFFMHTPFPEPEHFAELPQANSLMRGLLGSDFIGFHTKPYARNFLETCEQLNIGVVTAEHVILANRVTEVSNLPLGIDYTKYASATHLRAVQKEVNSLRRRYRGLKTILAYDRFDLTKGFLERLRAYQSVLKKHPEYHRKVVMVMIASPTRTDIPAYKRLKEEVEILVADINGMYGTRRWTPVDYRYEVVDFNQVNALYRIADIDFVAPIRDGMNLIAKEYVASRTEKRSGILILSRTAGAAEELSDAILVNPSRHSSLVQALEKALSMPISESNRRLKKMQKVLSVTTPQEWASTFMSNLKEASQVTRLRTPAGTENIQKEIKDAYLAAKSPLFLFDYDGVLTPFYDKPSDAKPTRQIIALIKKLASRKGSQIAIISGRAKENLEGWFGDLPVTLASEHGARLRTQQKEWQILADSADEWKEAIKPILERFAKLAPGAFVEEKSYSLVWHYRVASPYRAQKNLIQLRLALQPLAKKYKLGVYSGKKILEVKPPNVNKGVVAARLLKPSHDFVLAFGDDYTDEHLFAILPPSAYSIKVGPGATEARYRFRDTVKVQEFLEYLTS